MRRMEYSWRVDPMGLWRHACYKGGDVEGEVVMCKFVYGLQSLVSRWIFGRFKGLVKK